MPERLSSQLAHVEILTPTPEASPRDIMRDVDFYRVRGPSGLRIELNAGGYRNFAPDSKPVRWTPSQGSNSIYRNIAMPESMIESFPLVAARDESKGASGLFV